MIFTNDSVITTFNFSGISMSIPFTAAASPVVFSNIRIIFSVKSFVISFLTNFTNLATIYKQLRSSGQ